LPLSRSLPEAFATAYLNLLIGGGLQEGNTLLMHAGASGLASVIIPMAKAFGARVITSVLDDEKAANAILEQGENVGKVVLKVK
jgi:NADPH:quinone reductase-like Zn-dependent oxidoreductase